MTRVQTLIAWAVLATAALLVPWNGAVHADHPHWYHGGASEGWPCPDTQPDRPLPPASPLGYDPFFAKPRWGPAAWRSDNGCVVPPEAPEPPLSYDPFFAKPHWGHTAW